MMIWMIGCVLITGVLLLFEAFKEQRGFQVTNYNIIATKLAGLHSEKRIVLLSDLHNKVYGNHNEPLLAAIKKAKPDLILIAGDMLIGKEGEAADIAVEFVGSLTRLCPVYYGNGNHEQRMKEKPGQYGNVFSAYKSKLKAQGVIFLENTSTSFYLDDVPVQIHGLELSMRTYEKFKRNRITERDVRRCLGNAKQQNFQILIAHNPVYFDAYRDWGADLTVSGHLHGGIIRIPGFRGIITPQAVLFPKYSGEMTVDGDQRIVVSKGLGTHTVNLRVFNKAEVVVLHLNGKKNLV